MSKFVKIGHRGAMGYEPENTLASVKKAIDLGCDMIEIDVHLCITGEVIVIHDFTLDRTTNSKGLVNTFTIDEIKALNAGKGELIPTLEQVIDLLEDTSIKLNIELKGEGTANVVGRILRSYTSYPKWNSDRFLISSFNHIELLTFKNNFPEFNIGVLIYHLPHDLAKIGEDLNAYSLNTSKEFVTKTLIDDAHKRNLKLYVYTVNTKTEIEKLKEMCVDGIFTNYPDLF